MLALEQALAIANAQDIWDNQDDRCDCVYQRIGYWFNPYIGAIEEKRICCIDAKLREMWPELFRTSVIEPAEWNGESDMPAAIWHRQLANHFGVSVSEARALAGEPPKGRPIKVKPTFFLPWSGDYIEVRLG